MNKISGKDIDTKHNVSHNHINKIIDNLSKKTVLPNTLPTIINIDEFKDTKDIKGKMAFHIRKIIINLNIIENLFKNMKMIWIKIKRNTLFILVKALLNMKLLIAL